MILLAVGVFTAIGFKINWQETANSVKNANIYWLLAATISMLTAHYLRGWRWNMLTEPAGYPLNKTRAFYAVMIGYLVNVATSRGGEFVRCAMAAKSEKAPVPTLVGSVVTERIIDLLVLMSLCLLCLGIQFQEFYGFFDQYIITPAAKYYTPISLILLSGLLVFARVSDAFLSLRIMSFDLPLVLAPLVLVAMNIIYALAAWPVGILADRLPRWQLLALGIAALIAGALCLALASALPLAAIGLLLWGLSLALTQGVMAAMIADAAPAPLRATAFGLFNLASGVAMLLGNAASGALWDLRGASAAFMLTACVAALPLGLLPFLKRNRV